MPVSTANIELASLRYRVSVELREVVDTSYIKRIISNPEINDYILSGTNSHVCIMDYETFNALDVSVRNKFKQIFVYVQYKQACAMIENNSDLDIRPDINEPKVLNDRGHVVPKSFEDSDKEYIVIHSHEQKIKKSLTFVDRHGNVYFSDLAEMLDSAKAYEGMLNGTSTASITVKPDNITAANYWHYIRGETAYHPVNYDNTKIIHLDVTDCKVIIIGNLNMYETYLRKHLVTNIILIKCETKLKRNPQEETFPYGYLRQFDMHCIGHINTTINNTIWEYVRL